MALVVLVKSFRDQVKIAGTNGIQACVILEHSYYAKCWTATIDHSIVT